jgi:hypothetical protein
MLYMEQMLRIFPREYAVKLKMQPAYEETLMKIAESRATKRSGEKKEKPQKGGKKAKKVKEEEE